MEAKNKLNQSGMSAILFAMIFCIVLSLLALGFATLVRNDQRQTLDKTLSYQAQYAAEAGIEKVNKQFIHGTPPKETNPDCSDPNFSRFSIGLAQITCATWVRPSVIVANPINEVTPFVASFENTSTIDIKWKSADEIPKTGRYNNPGAFPSIGTIDDNNIPVLSFTISDNDTLSNFHKFYLVPCNGTPPNRIVNFNGGSMPDGRVICGIQDGEYVTGQITGLDSGIYAVNVVSIGGLAGLRVEGPGLVNRSQVAIDVNARAQDVTKRLLAYVPIETPSNTNPAYLYSVNSICKYYKVDGNNNTAPGLGNVCPDGTP